MHLQLKGFLPEPNTDDSLKFERVLQLNRAFRVYDRCAIGRSLAGSATATRPSRMSAIE